MNPLAILKYLRKMEGKSDTRAERVLELNPDAPAVQALLQADRTFDFTRTGEIERG